MADGQELSRLIEAECESGTESRSNRQPSRFWKSVGLVTGASLLLATGFAAGSLRGSLRGAAAEEVVGEALSARDKALQAALFNPTDGAACNNAATGTGTAANIPFGYKANAVVGTAKCTSASCNFASNAKDRAACLVATCQTKNFDYGANRAAKAGAETASCAGAVCDFIHVAADKTACTVPRQQCKDSTVLATAMGCTGGTPLLATLGTAGDAYCAGAACGTGDKTTCCVAKALCSTYTGTKTCDGGNAWVDANHCKANVCAAADTGAVGAGECCHA